MVLKRVGHDPLRRTSNARNGGAAVRQAASMSYVLNGTPLLSRPARGAGDALAHDSIS